MWHLTGSNRQSADTPSLSEDVQGRDESVSSDTVLMLPTSTEDGDPANRDLADAGGEEEEVEEVSTWESWSTSAGESTDSLDSDNEEGSQRKLRRRGRIISPKEAYDRSMFRVQSIIWTVNLAILVLSHYSLCLSSILVTFIPDENFSSGFRALGILIFVSFYLFGDAEIVSSCPMG